MRVRGPNNVGRALQTDPTLGPFIREKISRGLLLHERNHLYEYGLY